MNTEPPEEPYNSLIKNREAKSLGKAHQRCLNKAVNQVIQAGRTHKLAVCQNSGENGEETQGKEYRHQNLKGLGHCRRYSLRHLDLHLLVIGKLYKQPGSDSSYDDSGQHALVAEVVHIKATQLLTGLGHNLLRRHDDESTGSSQRGGELVAAPDAAQAVSEGNNQQEGENTKAYGYDIVAEPLQYLQGCHKAGSLVSVPGKAGNAGPQVHAVRTQNSAPRIQDYPLHNAEEGTNDDERQQHGEGISHGQQVLIAGHLAGNRHHDCLKLFNYGRIHFFVTPL